MYSEYNIMTERCKIMLGLLFVDRRLKGERQFVYRKLVLSVDA